MNKRKLRAKMLAGMASTAAIVAFSPIGASQEATANSDVKVLTLKEAPLGDALFAITTSYNVNIIADDALIAGKMSPAVSDELSAEGALKTVLLGSGLDYRVATNGAIIISEKRVAAPAPAIQNPTVPSVEEEPEEDDLVFDQIIVSGELIERTRQESLTSVVIAPGEELENRGDVDLYDLIERTPGVGILGGESGFGIRGIGQRGPGGGAGSGLTVSTTVDGETVSNSNRATFLGSYSVWDLGQVEILRGPQSTQTGRNALAGAIILRSNDPVYETEGRVRLEAASHDTYGGAFVFNTPIIEDKLALRIAGTSLESDGENENVTVGGASNARTDQTLRIGLRADPTDRLNIVLKHTISDVEAGDASIDPSLGLSNRQNTANFQTERINQKHSTNLRLSYDLSSAMQLDWESTYYETDWSFLTDIDGGPTPGGTRLDSATVESMQHEARLSFENERINGVIGAFYLEVDEIIANRFSLPSAELERQLENFFQFPFSLPESSLDTNSSNVLGTENYAVFGELEYQVTDQFDVTIGARYDQETIGTFDGESDTNYSDPTVALTPIPVFGTLGALFRPGSSTSPDRETTFDAFLPKVALGYDVNEDLRIGFTAQKGYRPGGSAVALGEPYEFDAEFTWNYELAFRSQWLDNRLTVNANAFYTDWTDQQISQQALPLTFLTVNAGKSRLIGAELDISANPTDDLELFASLAYVDTEFTDYVVETSGAITDFSGNEFAGAPPITAAIGATKSFPNGWYVSADASYTDEYFTSADNLETFGDYVLFNARIGYEQDRWSIFAYGRNVADKLYQ
ncbi:MAG: TonB-dependent receptor, partial [Pseudomonadota bacterium]